MYTDTMNINLHTRQLSTARSSCVNATINGPVVLGNEEKSFDGRELGFGVSLLACTINARLTIQCPHFCGWRPLPCLLLQTTPFHAKCGAAKKTFLLDMCEAM